MSKIVILAETGSDITEEVAKEYGIKLVPMHVSFGKDTKDDGTFPAEEIYAYYEKTGELPRTSGSVPEDFRRVIAEIREEDPECELLYLAYSAVTTCSYQSAQIAIDTDDIERIACVDTKHVAAGQYMVVVETAKANGLNVYTYLEYLLMYMPDSDWQNYPDVLDELMPWAQAVQEECKQ